jgi:DNA-binding MarR family transcriptional regulator
MSVALELPRARANAGEESFRGEYLRALRMIERLHRLLLDVIKDEFDRQGGAEINSVQALLLNNMGDDELTAGELKTRGYYLGSNVSYNVRKMVENGYLTQERSPHDRRSVRVKLSDKGLTLWKALDEMFDRHLTQISPGYTSENELNSGITSLRRLERFWVAAGEFGVRIPAPAA